MCRCRRPESGQKTHKELLVPRILDQAVERALHWGVQQLRDLSVQDSSHTIKRRYLYDEVAEHLRQIILSGELPPASRLKEPELAERFGISRTPLREAIKILSAEGLIELLPNRGARIANISPSEIDEMIEVIAGLECTAAELACARITQGEIDEIDRITATMVEAWKVRDKSLYFTLNREIHTAIMKASGNATLRGIYDTLGGRIQRARYTAHKTEQQWQVAVEDHQKIVELLKVKNAGKLVALMRSHLRRKKPVIAAAYASISELSEHPPGKGPEQPGRR